MRYRTILWSEIGGGGISSLGSTRSASDHLMVSDRGGGISSPVSVRALRSALGTNAATVNVRTQEAIEVFLTRIWHYVSPKERLGRQRPVHRRRLPHQDVEAVVSIFIGGASPSDFHRRRLPHQDVEAAVSIFGGGRAPSESCGTPPTTPPAAPLSWAPLRTLTTQVHGPPPRPCGALTMPCSSIAASVSFFQSLRCSTAIYSAATAAAAKNAGTISDPGIVPALPRRRPSAGRAAGHRAAGPQRPRGRPVVFDPKEPTN